MRHRIRTLARWARHRTGGSDSGQVTPFVVLLSVTLLAVAGLVLDAGLAISTKVQALDVAQSAARAGAQQLDLYTYRTQGVTRLDAARAASTARSWLAAADIDGNATATATTVTVTVRRTSRTQILQLVGVRDLTVTATATATAVHGVTGPNT